MGKKEKIDLSDIPELTSEDWKHAQRVPPPKTEMFRKAIERKLGLSRPRRVGRPTKYAAGKLRPITIRLHPRVIIWAKTEAKRLGVGYQTVINEALLHQAA